MKTLEQEMAVHVYDKITLYGSAHPKDSPERKKYGAMAHKLPILVRTAGLVEALAFVDSRGEKPHNALLEDLAQVVSSTEKKDFLNMSRMAEMQEYIYLTRRAMLALKWFKRFAQSVLEVEATDEEVSP